MRIRIRIRTSYQRIRIQAQNTYGSYRSGSGPGSGSTTLVFRMLFTLFKAELKLVHCFVYCTLIFGCFYTVLCCGSILGLHEYTAFPHREVDFRHM
jgi:hypothetical protein